MWLGKTQASLLGAIMQAALGTRYDVSPDGQRFLVNLSAVGATANPSIRVVVNWTTGIERN